MRQAFHPEARLFWTTDGMLNQRSSEDYIAGMSGVEVVRFSACLSGMPGLEGLRRAHEILDFAGVEQERHAHREDDDHRGLSVTGARFLLVDGRVAATWDVRNDHGTTVLTGQPAGHLHLFRYQQRYRHHRLGRRPWWRRCRDCRAQRQRRAVHHPRDRRQRGQGGQVHPRKRRALRHRRRLRAGARPAPRRPPDAPAAAPPAPGRRTAPKSTTAPGRASGNVTWPGAPRPSATWSTRAPLSRSSSATPSPRRSRSSRGSCAFGR